MQRWADTWCCQIHCVGWSLWVLTCAHPELLVKTAGPFQSAQYWSRSWVMCTGSSRVWAFRRALICKLFHRTRRPAIRRCQLPSGYTSSKIEISVVILTSMGFKVEMVSLILFETAHPDLAYYDSLATKAALTVGTPQQVSTWTWLLQLALLLRHPQEPTYGCLWNEYRR